MAAIGVSYHYRASLFFTRRPCPARRGASAHHPNAASCRATGCAYSTEKTMSNPVIKWAANQRCEAIVNGEKIAFWLRDSNNAADLAGTLDAAMASSANRQHAMMDGFKKRVNDACAGAKTIATMRDVIVRLCDHYNGGSEDWSVRGGIRQPLNRAALFAAIAKVKRKKPEAVEQLYRDRQDDVLRAFLTVADIAAEYAKLTGGKPSDDAANLLAELDAA